MSKSVKCPTCKKEVEWSALSKFRPFCCDRCRLIDLGEWASEKHAIPAEPIPSTEDFSSLTEDDSGKI